MSIEALLGTGAGICTSVSMLPQIIKTIRTKEAEEVAFGMLLTLLAGLILWIVYGFMKHDIPIIATNIFSLLLNLTMLGLRMKYGKK